MVERVRIASKRLTYFQRFLRVMSNKINSQKIKRIVITDYNKESKEYKDRLRSHLRFDKYRIA